MNTQLLKINDIDWDKFELCKFGRTVKLLYNKELFQLQTPSLYLPFGVNKSTNQWSNFSDFYTDCSINKAGMDNSFELFLSKLDEKVKELVQENAHLFQKTNSVINKETLVMNSSLRENGSYPKLLRLTLPRDNFGNFLSIVFDENSEKLKLDELNASSLLPKKKIIKSIIECSKVWYWNDKIGITWSISQLKYKQPTTNTILPSSEYLFVD